MDKSIELYQSRLSLFQSDMWMIFINSLSYARSYKFDVFVIQEYENYIYVASIIKDQLHDLNLLPKLIDYIRYINVKNKPAYIDFQILENDEITPHIIKSLNEVNVFPTTSYIIPRIRCLVDLSYNIEQIKGNYKNKTLNDIYRAEKAGVIVVEDWNTRRFYELYLETAQRQHFVALPFEYFNNLCSILKQNSSGKLLFSTKQNYPYFNTAIIVEYNKISYYLYTGSNSMFNSFNGSSVLQHYIIQLFKNTNCIFYDLMGVRKDINFGPTKFKLKFGNKIIKLLNAFKF